MCLHLDGETETFWDCWNSKWRYEIVAVDHIDRQERQVRRGCWYCSSFGLFEITGFENDGDPQP